MAPIFLLTVIFNQFYLVSDLYLFLCVKSCVFFPPDTRKSYTYYFRTFIIILMYLMFVSTSFWGEDLSKLITSWQKSMTVEYSSSVCIIFQSIGLFLICQCLYIRAPGLSLLRFNSSYFDCWISLCTFSILDVVCRILIIDWNIFNQPKIYKQKKTSWCRGSKKR